jgi:hypothetical protein
METVTFFTLYGKITISLSRDQVLRVFKTGLKDVVEKMSGKKPIIFRSRVALEVAI